MIWLVGYEKDMRIYLVPLSIVDLEASYSIDQDNKFVVSCQKKNDKGLTLDYLNCFGHINTLDCAP